jgi:hypothetical protein
MRRIITIVAVVATMLLGTTATALAFVPPGGDPAGNFTVTECDAFGLIDAHPGAVGQETAIGANLENAERTVGAWNATSDDFSNSEGKSQIGLCGPLE